jgi:peptidyl-prolyl cis-trans isomerase D
MLALFRRSQRVLLVIILGVIIFTFVIWGGLSGGRFLPERTTRVMGFVGTKEVTSDELASAVRGVLVNLRLMGYPQELLTQSEEIEREGWRRLIQVDQARKDGVAASGDEVSGLVIRLLFGEQGRFDQATYRRMVAELGGNMKPREFEEHIRSTLLIEKVRQTLGQCVLTTEDDVRLAYQNERTLIQLGYVPFYYTNYLAGQIVTTNELVEFYNTNVEEFRVPPQVELTLALEPVRLAESELTDDEAREYYEENLDDFLITNDVAAADDGSEAGKAYQPFEDVHTDIIVRVRQQRAEEIAYDRVEQMFFALSGTTTRDAGGRAQSFRDEAQKLEISTLETGRLTLEDMIPGVSNTYELVRAAFSMRPGDYSDMVEIPGVGYALYMVTERRDSYVPELEEIEDDVREEIATRRARDAAAAAAGQLRGRMAQATGTFVAAVAALGYTADVTEPLDRASGIEAVGCPAEIVARVFAFPVNSLVVVPCAQGSLLACPVKMYEADTALMYSEMDEYLEKLTRQTQALLFNLWFANAAAQVRVVDQMYEPETGAGDEGP